MNALGATAGRSVKAELRDNLKRKLRAREAIFPGIRGYDDSVIPQIVNAILSRHNFILLGLRGQAKTRILRQLTNLLDDEIPVIQDSELHDDPFAPVSVEGREIVERCGAATPIAGVPREARYVEK
ncbi:MAG: magnesium chelatase, partial [Deinococcales bacterium]